MNAHIKIQFEINSQPRSKNKLTKGPVNAHIKIQFEINSQQTIRGFLFTLACECSHKDTI